MFNRSWTNFTRYMWDFLQAIKNRSQNKLELKNATVAPKMIFALHKTDPPHSQYRPFQMMS